MENGTGDYERLVRSSLECYNHVHVAGSEMVSEEMDGIY